MDGRGMIPLVIGPAEASAIIHSLEGLDFPRPLTHDLLLSVISTLKAQVDRVVISELMNDTYYAQIHLKNSNQSYTIDARPSDAIALALRANCDIYISEKVAAQAMIAQPIDDQEMEDFRKFLEDLSPEDFKKSN